jgi:hypothetical protein
MPLLAASALSLISIGIVDVSKSNLRSTLDPLNLAIRSAVASHLIERLNTAMMKVEPPISPEIRTSTLEVPHVLECRPSKYPDNRILKQKNWQESLPGKLRDSSPVAINLNEIN